MIYILEYNEYGNVVGVHATPVSLEEWVGNSFGKVEIDKDMFNTCRSNINAWVWDTVNARLVPRIQITTDKQQITTVETCIITATITPPEGEALVDEEVIFTVDGTDYPVTTVNGVAQIEYSNENPGLHEIQVRSTTKYGQNSIMVEVIE